MGTIILRDGEEEIEVLVESTMYVLKELLKEAPVLFYELVQKARNPDHKFWASPIIEKLRDKWKLLESEGSMHDGIRHIIVNAVQGDGFEMTLVWPGRKNGAWRRRI
jgi:hypothetical protein